ncbi:sugar ABC transporter substrate-binding protein [Kineococcus rhizosphaerae]|uniref:Monosaccharide ABC transporter substrate-binding protein (CUT2 family) n=1 Tax=Kineococcus rhizosphaerae TaxID=559628 RepID=A0A2T0RAY3_9ACTN|nr:sugar ABC transporter substrate-binding protein [Kineococcus rhizosphaerae]PRY18291.1 monosaccharide ABC transporter substrate-binding protein (CUT2 family) [Kineococcus rhizosphaerae]
MKNSSRRAVVALGGAALLALTGCANGATSATGGGSASAKGRVAYSPTSVQIPVLAQTGDKLKGTVTGAGYGYDLIDGDYDASTQIQQVTQALDNGSVKAAWVAPVAGPATKPLVEHAQQLGVPILVQTVPGDLGFSGPQPGVVFQGPNFAKFGTALGEQVTKCVTDKGLQNPEALLLSGPDTLPGTAESKKAAEAAFSGSVDVVGQAQVADIATAQTQTKQLLIAHPDAKVVIALTDEGALGAINAYKADGEKPDCVVLGGGGPDAVTAQKAGEITSIVAWDFLGAVPAGWEALQKVIADPKAEGAVLDIPFTITE